MSNAQRNVLSVLGGEAGLEPAEEVSKTPGHTVGGGQWGPTGESHLPEPVSIGALSPEVACLSVTTPKARESGESGAPAAAAASLAAGGEDDPRLRQGDLAAPRVRRCLGLENHITSSRLAPGQGREKC